MKLPSRSPSSKPSIAVIIPNRNDARHLPRCIGSILDQEVTPDELIVVDDQSTDDSVAVIRSLIAGRSGAQLIENPVNLGTYGAMDEGLMHSRSEYVLFLAANDYVLPGIFAHAKACLARHRGVGLWAAMGWLVDDEDHPLRLHSSPVVAIGDACFSPEDCVRLAWRFGGWFAGTTVILHRETLDAVGRFDPAYKGLSDLLTDLVVASLRGAVYSPRPFAVIRVQPGSYYLRTLRDAASLETMLERLRERGPMVAPALFTPAFLDRIAQRFRFASLRAGAAMGGIAEKYAGWRRRALAWVDRTLPARWRRARLALAFIVLRPFDLVPTFWNRFGGWLYVTARSKLDTLARRANFPAL